MPQDTSSPKSAPISTPSILKVALEAGVSRMTVSRVINCPDKVKPETAEKVNAVIEKLGYRPNPMVQSLMSQVRNKRVLLSSNIAWLEPHYTSMQEKRIGLLRSQARIRAKRLGYGFEVIQYIPEEFSAARLHSILRARGVRGVIIAPMSHPGMALQFPWEHYSTATIGRSLVSPEINHVMMHFHHAMLRVRSEVIARGYSRIGFMTWKNADSRSENLQMMFMTHFNQMASPDCRIEPLWMDGCSKHKVEQWLKANRPDVIVSSFFDDWKTLKDIGIQMPQSIGYVTLSARKEQPDVCGICVPIEALANGVVDSVDAQIHRNERGIPKSPQCILFEGEWIDGKTLRSRIDGD